MIQTYQVLPVVAIVCSASAFAQNAADPVQMVKQNIDLISSANKVLDDVKDNAAVEIAIKQLNALTQQAKQLDKSMEKMRLTSEQAIRITKLNGDAQDTIVDMLENCERIQKDKLMTPALLKAVNDFADAANIDVVDFRNYNFGLDQLIADNDYDQILVLYSFDSLGRLLKKAALFFQEGPFFINFRAGHFISPWPDWGFLPEPGSPCRETCPGRRGDPGGAAGTWRGKRLRRGPAHCRR